MDTPTEPRARTSKAFAVAVRRTKIMSVIVALLVLGGLRSASALWRSAARSAGSTPAPQATATATETVAFQSIVVATMAPTRTPRTPTAIPSASPTSTLSPTPSVTPSPTRTPVPPKNDVTRIVAPAIRLDSKVVPVGITERYKRGVVERVWEVANHAAGYHKGTALPGQVGNTVIAGHNNVRGAVFANLFRLAEGDDVYVYLDDIPYRYQVREIVKVLIKGASPEEVEENLRYIMPTDDERLTLVTCWPPWTSTYRLIVICRPVPLDQ